ncbi:Calcineurin-like phosphoesterase [uncultured virus]|nr:Calcineurin-like phosphoesterase [uncultured virus]
MQILILLFIISLSDCKDIGTFLQITDIHFDQFYDVNSPANCLFGSIGFGCCRKYSIPIEPYRSASKWGDYNCDLPFLFVDESLKWISNNIEIPDFILWNGDNVDHHDITQSFISNFNEINITTSLMNKYFNKSIIIPVIGNHDTYPIDQLWYNFKDTELSFALSDIWSNMIPTDQKLSFSHGGYYIKKLNKKTNLIIINSLLYDSNNIFSYFVNDPSNQNQWLHDTLQQMRQDDSNVWIVGHIPIGSYESKTNFTDYFYNITVEYSDIIKYQFWGHTHEDYYYLFMDNNNKPVGFSFVAPSLVADERFSSFRQYIYDRDSFEILDYIQYNANLTDIIINDRMAFNVNYVALNSYELQNFTPDSF